MPNFSHSEAIMRAFMRFQIKTSSHKFSWLSGLSTYLRKNMEEEKKEYDDEIRELPEGNGIEPPPIPKSVDDEWAETLGVPNNVPPIPNPQSPDGNAQCTQPNAQSTPMNSQFGMHNVQLPYGGQQKPWMQNRQNAANPMQDSPAEPMPSTWLVWSVVCTILCCFVPGIVAIIQSSKVSSRYYAGDIEGAKKASRRAEVWIIISFVLGVISNTLYLPLTIAGFL